MATVFGSVLISGLVFGAICAGLILGWNQLPAGPVRFGLLALLLIPVAFLLIKWISLKFLKYEITTERVKVTTGILSRRTDELELYRVKDLSLIEPFVLRMFGAGNILLLTNDANNPQLELKGIRDAKNVREELRSNVEDCRVRKGSRVTEME